MSLDRREWLEADGLGGFASGTVSGARTRRYHALLLAAARPPADRVVLVNGFEAHVELLHSFLSQRDAIVEKIQGLLNAQRKPIQHQQDTLLLTRHFEECFFTREQLNLKNQLDEVHWVSGFKPRKTPGLHNDLIDPAEHFNKYILGQVFNIFATTKKSRDQPEDHWREHPNQTLLGFPVPGLGANY